MRGFYTRHILYTIHTHTYIYYLLYITSRTCGTFLTFIRGDTHTRLFPIKFLHNAHYAHVAAKKGRMGGGGTSRGFGLCARFKGERIA